MTFSQAMDGEGNSCTNYVSTLLQLMEENENDDEDVCICLHSCAVFHYPLFSGLIFRLTPLNIHK